MISIKSFPAQCVAMRAGPSFQETDSQNNFVKVQEGHGHIWA